MKKRTRERKMSDDKKREKDRKQVNREKKYNVGEILNRKF